MGKGVVNVAKLCIEIPDSLLKRLKEISKEMATEPESLILQYLWLLNGIGRDSVRGFSVRESM